MDIVTLSDKNENSKTSNGEIVSPFIIVKNISIDRQNELTYLSEEERTRYFEIQDLTRKSQYYWGRYYLRHYLSDILSIPALDIVLKTDENGKPFVDGNKCYISLTHSERKLGLIVAPSPCGIDIEKMVPREQMQSIMKKMFSQGEIEEIQKSKNPQTEFYKKWTLREAFFKMTQSFENFTPEQKAKMNAVVHSQVIEHFALSYVWIK